MTYSDDIESTKGHDIVYSPLPWIKSIAQGLRPGKIISCCGQVLSSSKEERIIVNLCCGVLVEGQQVDNVTLHVSVRFDEGVIVLNSLIANKWGDEQRLFNPFQKGHQFDLRILVLTDCYRVAGNGKELGFFKHRLDLNDVQALYIKGCATLNFVEIGGQELGVPLGLKSIGKGNSILHPGTPFVEALPRGIAIGQQIMITATPSANAVTFVINLCSRTDVAFHISCRMQEQHCVRNSQQNGKWMEEEREIPCFPFMASATFDMLLLCDRDGYRVAVNGQHCFHFSHRVPFQCVDTFTVAGDIRIQQIVLSE